MASRRDFGMRCAFPPEIKATRTRAAAKRSSPRRRAPHLFRNRDNLNQVVQHCQLQKVDFHRTDNLGSGAPEPGEQIADSAQHGESYEEREEPSPIEYEAPATLCVKVLTMSLDVVGSQERHRPDDADDDGRWRVGDAGPVNNECQKNARETKTQLDARREVGSHRFVCQEPKSFPSAHRHALLCLSFRQRHR